jgi:hypothetical protein
VAVHEVGGFDGRGSLAVLGGEAIAQVIDGAQAVLVEPCFTVVKVEESGPELASIAAAILARRSFREMNSSSTSIPLLRLLNSAVCFFSMTSEAGVKSETV